MLRCQIIPKHDVALYIPLEIFADLVHRRQMIHFSVRVMLSSPGAVFSSRLSLDRIHCALPPPRWKGRDCERAASPFNSALMPQGLCRPDEGYS